MTANIRRAPGKAGAMAAYLWTAVGQPGQYTRPGRALENLRFAFSKPPFVISTEAKRSGEICGHPFPEPHRRVITTLPFVISTEAKRSGEICGRPFPEPQLRAITVLPFVISTEAKRSGEICGHPLPELHRRAITILPFVISTEAKRSGEICGHPFPELHLRAITTLPFVISTEAYPDSSLAALARITGAVSFKGNSMKLINATVLDRKSVGAQSRDLCVDTFSWGSSHGPLRLEEGTAVRMFQFRISSEAKKWATAAEISAAFPPPAPPHRVKVATVKRAFSLRSRISPANHPSCSLVGAPFRPPVPVLPPMLHPTSLRAAEIPLAVPPFTVSNMAFISRVAVLSFITCEGAMHPRVEIP